MDRVTQVHQRISENLDRLPPMPHTVAEVMQMSNAEDNLAKDLANTVCKDPTLAARVLGLCNSGFFGMSQEVTSVQRAVLLLGFDMVKNLVFSTFVHSAVQEDAVGYAQSAEALWAHSLGVATACMGLAEELDPKSTDLAYTAGLLHDIGKIAFASLLTEHAEEVVQRVQSRKESFVEAEHQVLGTTHAKVGALIAERWQLAPELQVAIQHHHEPEQSTEHKKLVALVNLGDSICSILGIGSGLDATDCVINDWSLQTLGVSHEKLEESMAGVVARLMSLDQQPQIGA